MKKYAESHEWIVVEGEVGTVGITNYAQKELGEIVHVELPEVGKEIARDQEVVVLESTKAAADIYSPVSGTITAVNESLRQSPDKVNHAAETDGWLYKIALSASDELVHLLDEKSYQALLK